MCLCWAVFESEKCCTFFRVQITLSNIAVNRGKGCLSVIGEEKPMAFLKGNLKRS